VQLCLCSLTREYTNSNAKTPVHLAPRAQAQYNAEELLRKREEISDLIRQNLTKRASEFHLILDGTPTPHSYLMCLVVL
jgi:hypothetical protein